MFDYVNVELPELLSTYFHVSKTNKSVAGFSMGGHGSLISSLKTGAYKSASCLAPIAHPSTSVWGTKAF